MSAALSPARPRTGRAPPSSPTAARCSSTRSPRWTSPSRRSSSASCRPARIRRVGGSELTRVDVRIICATNRDPFAEVEAGRFRADLFYRLHVLPIHLPPLRERREDVLPLADAFLARFAAEEGPDLPRLRARGGRRILACPWPGNVRQLENAIRRIVVLHDGGDVTAAMLPASSRRPARTAARQSPTTRSTPRCRSTASCRSGSRSGGSSRRRSPPSAATSRAPPRRSKSAPRPSIASAWPGPSEVQRLRPALARKRAGIDHVRGDGHGPAARAGERAGEET